MRRSAEVGNSFAFGDEWRSYRGRAPLLHVSSVSSVSQVRWILLHKFNNSNFADICIAFLLHWPWIFLIFFFNVSNTHATSVATGLRGTWSEGEASGFGGFGPMFGYTSWEILAPAWSTAEITFKPGRTAVIGMTLLITVHEICWDNVGVFCSRPGQFLQSWSSLWSGLLWWAHESDEEDVTSPAVIDYWHLLTGWNWQINPIRTRHRAIRERSARWSGYHCATWFWIHILRQEDHT